MPPEDPAAPATPTPPAAAATPSAAAPAAPGTPATPAASAPGAAAAPQTNIVAGATPGAAPTPAPAAPAAPTKDEQLAYLTSKGVKPEDVAKLDDAGIKAKHDELKAADAKAAAIKAIEIKVPDGTAVNEEQLTKLKEIVADANLSPSERAQKLVDMHAATLKEVVEGPVKVWMDTQKQWQANVKADPELGGANYTNVEATIAKFLDSIGGKEAAKMREAFIFTGAGNHPEIVRLMYRAGKIVTEGQHVNGVPPGESKEADMQRKLASMYPSASDARPAA